MEIRGNLTKGIKLSIQKDGELVDLEVTFVDRDFSGRGECCTSLASLAEFANNASKYPLVEPYPLIEGGVWSVELSKVIQPRVRLRIAPVGNRGQIVIEVYVAEFDELEAGDVNSYCFSRLPATYAGIGEMSSSLLKFISEEDTSSVFEYSLQP